MNWKGMLGAAGVACGAGALVLGKGLLKGAAIGGVVVAAQQTPSAAKPTFTEAPEAQYWADAPLVKLTAREFWDIKNAIAETCTKELTTEFYSKALPEAKRVQYCGCASRELMKFITADDIRKTIETGTPTPAFVAKREVAYEKCGDEAFGPPPAPAPSSSPGRRA